MNQDDVTVFWKGERIGVTSDPKPDMWYLEGDWQPLECQAARAFARIVARYHPERSYRRLDGEWVDLASEPQERDVATVPAIVISLVEGRLFLRCILSKEAQELRHRRGFLQILFSRFRKSGGAVDAGR